MLINLHNTEFIPSALLHKPELSRQLLICTEVKGRECGLQRGETPFINFIRFIYLLPPFINNMKKVHTIDPRAVTVFYANT